MRLGVLFCIGVAACSSSTTTTTFTCGRAHRHGAYRITYTEEAGGQCGPVASVVVDLNAPPDPSLGCKVNSSEWSDGDCKFTSDLTCTQADGREHFVTVTREASPDGATLNGTATWTLTNASGKTCVSTYDLSYVRQ